MGPKIVMGFVLQILDQISKITPVSDLLSYKGCLSVERPRTLGGDKKFTVVKYLFIYLFIYYANNLSRRVGEV